MQTKEEINEFLKAREILSNKAPGTKIIRAKLETDRYQAEPSYLNFPNGKWQVLAIEFKNSYIVDEEENIIKIGKNKLGKGAYSSVKLITSSQVLKIQHVNNRKTNSLAQIEAYTNIQAGITNSFGFYRISPRGVKKFYQRVKYLGETLSKKIDPNWSLDYCLSISIALLLKIHTFHTGEAFLDKRPRVHRDIKPDNVTLDDNGQIHLIDYGYTTTDLLNKGRYGTPHFFPIDIDLTKGIHGPTSEEIEYSLSCDGMLRDKIATLRTIYHPAMSEYERNHRRYSIFTKSKFESLPTCLQELLNTTQISRHIHNSIETMPFFIEVLQFYKDNKDITPIDIEKIKTKFELSHIPNEKVLQLAVKIHNILTEYETKDIGKQQYRNELLAILNKDKTSEKNGLIAVLAMVKLDKNLDKNLSTYRNRILQPKNLKEQLLAYFYSWHEEHYHSKGERTVDKITNSYRTTLKDTQTITDMSNR